MGRDPSGAGGLRSPGTPGTRDREARDPRAPRPRGRLGLGTPGEARDPLSAVEARGEDSESLMELLEQSTRRNHDS